MGKVNEAVQIGSIDWSGCIRCKWYVTHIGCTADLTEWSLKVVGESVICLIGDHLQSQSEYKARDGDIGGGRVFERQLY